jgi:hypothetical protein
MPNPPITAAALQTAAVLLGYFWGAAAASTPALYTVWALLAVLLMFVGAVQACRGAEPKYGVVSVIALLHSVGVIYCEPFLHFGHPDDFARVALVLAPLVFAIGYLARGRAWPSAAGVTLFVFTSSAMIGSNANNGVHGSGFFSSWIA